MADSGEHGNDLESSSESGLQVWSQRQEVTPSRGSRAQRCITFIAAVPRALS